MREIADQVFAHSAAADSAQLRSKQTVLSERLTSLLRICAQYKQLLEEALRNRGASLSPSTPAGLNVDSPPTAARGSPHRSIVVLPTEVSAFQNLLFTSAQVACFYYDFFICNVQVLNCFSPLFSMSAQSPGRATPSSRVPRATSMDERTFTGTAHPKYVG